ncbi:hypothetical protein ONS95_003407 [Cadophora gregata]|uniref:uncharacterized protein n=1 Tax=Cadophora gregata TaxID=51156 RepID=UPI0026DA949D|nr:uncharacterized protein ONS95_003407 [Cadophora gregata]KAK0108612.1 hypothetical protein ONS95_003407 [Cadophora gregata]KAK0108794.1 hypothetical protein ONS96_002639 [Cadophora gregata f. sp. sojae]
MKIILTGSSGFIGSEVLTQAISNPEITSIIALSRKPLPENLTSNPKVSVVIIDDFTSYTPDVLKKLEGAEGCIWAIGAKSTNIEVTRKVTVEYTLAAVKAFSALPRPVGRPFRFVFLSGFVVVRDQNASVWFFPEARKVAVCSPPFFSLLLTYLCALVILHIFIICPSPKLERVPSLTTELDLTSLTSSPPSHPQGQAELNLLSFAENNHNNNAAGFESYIARPTFVLSKEVGGFKGLVMMGLGLLPSVRVDVLARGLIDVAVRGGEIRVLENGVLVERGRGERGERGEER